MNDDEVTVILQRILDSIISDCILLQIRGAHKKAHIGSQAYLPTNTQHHERKIYSCIFYSLLTRPYALFPIWQVMIYLIEGVLPESYFANSLRGLSVDMAVFRDLLRVKLPSLSRHLEQLQNDSKDSGDIITGEP